MIYIASAEGLKIPAIGLGTGSIKTESEIETIINAALETGYRHIDTAYYYQNEILIGKVLQKWFSSGKLKREDLFITTKLPIFAVHPDRVETFMKKSLENLQLDYVDLYLVHFPVPLKYNQDKDWSDRETEIVDHIELWKKMEEQVTSGRTKAIGISNFNIRQAERILNCCKIKPACIQIELHVNFQQRELVEFCQKNGMVVVAYSPLGSQRSSANISTSMMENTTIKHIAEKYSKTPAQIMLRYLLQKSLVVIPRSRNPSRIHENFEVLDFRINSEDMKSLNDLETGETARVITFSLFPGIEEHPEWPFSK